jgi:penicillin amidase
MLLSVRLALRIAAGLALFFGLAALAGYGFLRQSLPKASGEIHLPGLKAQVEVLRDRHGIPHIYAASLEDAHFALGFVHAQDRLWQMEINRRIGSGRLAELLGPAALDADRLMRTLGLRRVAGGCRHAGPPCPRGGRVQAVEHGCRTSPVRLPWPDPWTGG